MLQTVLHRLSMISILIEFIHNQDIIFGVTSFILLCLIILKASTVKPLLSGPPIQRTSSIKWKLSWVSFISLYNKPLFSGHLY